jgi:hypothetical protein
MDYYPVVYSKGRVYQAEEYSEEYDWVRTRGINNNLIGKVKALPVQSINDDKESLRSNNFENKNSRTFTTMNSDLQSRQDGISMGSRISEMVKKPSQKNQGLTNLKNKNQGTL